MPTSGAILLVRHGEPALSRDVRLNAQGYREFWAQYEAMGIKPGQTAPADLCRALAGGAALITSTRPRAIESAALLPAGSAAPSYADLVEAPLPPPHLPAWVRLHPSIWGFLARVCWWYLGHHEGLETRAEAEARAVRAADLLIARAEAGDVVVLAHGFFNYLIGRALRRRGWRLAKSEGYKYWSMRRFERR